MAVRHTTRSRTRTRTRSRTGTLLVSTGALLLVAHVGGWPLASRPPQATADGVGRSALVLSVTVNKKTPRQAERIGIRVGHPVVKRYRLTNRSGADLHRVTLTDPSVPGKALRCPRGQGFWMRGMSSVTCTARFSAAPGRHSATVRARGEIPSLGMRPTASMAAGYQGVTGALALAVTVTRAVAPQALVRYTISNPGNRTVHGARLVDPVLGRTPVDCAGRPGPPQALGPGAVAVCVARLTGLRPGTYRSTPEVRGSDRLFTLGPTCTRLVRPPVLVARATAPFVVRPRPVAPPPPPPPPVRAVPPPGGGGGGAGGGGVVPPGGAGGAGGGGGAAIGGAGGVGGGGAAGIAGAGGGAGTGVPGGVAGAVGAPGAPGALGAAAAGAGTVPGAAGAGPAAGAAVPGLTAPGAAVPGLTAPGAAVPGLTAPGAAVPGLTAPGATVPGLTAPGATVPGLTAPGATVPGLPLPPGVGVPPGGIGPGTGLPPGTGAGVGPRSPADRAREPSPTAENRRDRGLTARARGTYRRDDSMSPAVFLLLLFLPAAALVVLASRRL
ncbi:hypothetical protein [Streptomyces lavendofoliae]|uniref:Uncharacterized protein n=1 Tax=Streptomyces lavendofoliae TaxID=67314 RepID=A0A918M2R9_9ACTN|nr:hypothetical protein [Streptomyces lavendofoliae]GGU27807.1 hypothetical protein GCM10010274_13120 [Streptomyces lavendofoliae]